MSTQAHSIKVKNCDDKVALGKLAAKEGAQRIRDAIRASGKANIIVATGASQFEMLAALITEPDIQWNRVTAFHLDEYVGLPITHPASFRMYLWKRFVSQLPLPLANFYYVDGDASHPGAECNRLGEIIAKRPIDVAFVGIGENAHLAFNDPPADFQTMAPYIVVQLDEGCRRQQSGEGWFPSLEAVPHEAISMSVRQIMKSRSIICSVPDDRKSDAVRRTLKGDVSPMVPASILQQHPDCTLYLDRASAKALSKETSRC